MFIPAKLKSILFDKKNTNNDNVNMIILIIVENIKGEIPLIYIFLIKNAVRTGIAALIKK